MIENAGLAQLVEQRTCNAKVNSSNPLSGTMIIRKILAIVFFFLPNKQRDIHHRLLGGVYFILLTRNNLH